MVTEEYDNAILKVLTMGSWKIKSDLPTFMAELKAKGLCIVPINPDAEKIAHAIPASAPKRRGEIGQAWVMITKLYTNE